MAPTLEAVREAVSSRLSPRALAHSERVAEMAAVLATNYGLDADEARLGGLLHDWDRELSGDELIARAREFGIEVTEVDETIPYLLHGPVARCELPAVFPDLSEAVLDAVGEHTYGTASMSPLSMVVYIADVIEPGREHKAAERVRRRIGECSLAELFADAYTMSLTRIVKRKRPIHPATLEVWNQLVAGGRA